MRRNHFYPDRRRRNSVLLTVFLSPAMIYLRRRQIALDFSPDLDYNKLNPEKIGNNP